MRSAHGQATVEYVGVLLVVAVLIGAITGGLGVPGAIAASITHAFLGAIGIEESGKAAADARPSAAEREAFARAVDRSVAPGDRPALRDVRLALIAQHGDAQGRAIYRQLILDDLRTVVPGLAGPTLFATATSGLRQPGVLGIYLPINAALSLERPTPPDDGEIETAMSAPNAHVVTVTEADHALAHALHPGTSYGSIALDVVSMIPVVGNVTRAASLGARLLKGANAISNAVTIARDASALLAPSADASPPGSREGDEIVSWIGSRCPLHGGFVRRFERTAVVRDGVVIRESIRWPYVAPDQAPPRPPPPERCP
jgi:hypothetical protein